MQAINMSSDSFASQMLPLDDEVIQQVFHGQGPAYLGHGVEGYLSLVEILF